MTTARKRTRKGKKLGHGPRRPERPIEYFEPSLHAKRLGRE